MSSIAQLDLIKRTAVAYVVHALQNNGGNRMTVELTNGVAAGLDAELSAAISKVLEAQQRADAAPGGSAPAVDAVGDSTKSSRRRITAPPRP